MRLERRPADQPHDQRRGGEDADLGGNHRPDRQAEAPEREKLAPSGPPGEREEPQGPHARVDQRKGDEEREHQRLRERGRHARADDPERGHAELAEDQRVIGERVEATAIRPTTRAGRGRSSAAKTERAAKNIRFGARPH